MNDNNTEWIKFGFPLWSRRWFFWCDVNCQLTFSNSNVITFSSHENVCDNSLSLQQETVISTAR